MKIALIPAIVAPLALAAFAAHEPTPREPQGSIKRAAPRNSSMSLLIERLGDADDARAKTAMHALIRGGKPAAAALRKALGESPDNDRFKARAERILPLCDVDAPVHKGLKLGLQADHKTVRPGDKVTLTATICNVSDDDVVLFTGMSYAGNAFENGASLMRIDARAEPPAETGVRWTVGFCGTGSYPLSVRIPALSAKRFSFTATYDDGKQPRDKPSGRVPGPTLSMGYCALPLGEAAVHSLRISHVGRTDVGDWRPKGVRKETPNWIGKLQSNQIVLRTRN